MVSTPVSINAAQTRVSNAIRTASLRSGVDFSYLFNQARIESGLNPAAQARTSSARGLYQFIDQTWLATVRRHGQEHGLGWAADAIRHNRSGRFSVDDPATRRSIMALRDNPEVAAAMAAEFASDNRDHLESALGRAAEPVDLYLAHFLGAGGATRFLRAHDADPSAPAAPMLPQAAHANRSIFYDRSGNPRSLSAIRARFAERLGAGAGAMPSANATPFDAAAPQPTPQNAIWRPMPSDQLMGAQSPSTARLAYLMLASLGAESLGTEI